MSRGGAVRNRALRGKGLVRDEDLAPGIAAGLTQGASAEEALSEHPVSTAPSGLDVVRHMAHADERLERSGLPYAAFVAANSFDAVWSDGATDRKQMDYNKTYTAEGMRLLREGRQCLRCDEPHPAPFPVECDVCGYSMKDRQIMDIAMEFEGMKHLGPSRPIAEYLAEQDVRMEKRRYIDRIREGGQGKIPREWLRDATLFPGGPPRELA